MNVWLAFFGGVLLGWLAEAEAKINRLHQAGLLELFPNKREVVRNRVFERNSRPDFCRRLKFYYQKPGFFYSGTSLLAQTSKIHQEGMR